MSEYWGHHLILDCKSGSKKLIRDKQNLKNFVDELVNRIDMVAVGEPIIKFLASNAVDKAGYSLVQLIETSSIVGHFINSSGDFYLDVFSCKEFEIEKVTECVDEFFSPLETKSRYLLRE
jgi:S-adenosylmethionine/arginine decarboxylase-like enzyme|tara:strand:- start:57 stop:416 length:360 start_codon:yes stop_codon:yes gene_type:complete